MKTHISLNVKDVNRSVDFYSRFFSQSAQKQTKDYAKFDLENPGLNFSLIQNPSELSKVSHFGVEVTSSVEMRYWENRLRENGLIGRTENNTNCCFALQDKIWVEDPDGNAWEVFYVREQLLEGRNTELSFGGCCVKNESSK